MNLNATFFDPYGLDEENNRINVFHVKNGGGLLRLTSANVNMNFKLNNDTFKRGEVEEEEEEEDIDALDFAERERLSGGGREDDLFGKSNDFSNGLFNKDEKSEAITGDLYRTKIPWNLTFAHSLTYRNNVGQKDISNNSLMISGDVDLTQNGKWAYLVDMTLKEKVSLIPNLDLIAISIVGA